MAVQTAYQINQDALYAGQLVELGPRDVVSRSVETAAGAAFGLAVSPGTDAARQIVIGGDATFLGITVRELSREGAANTGAVQYNETETAAVMRWGYIAVVCPTGCIVGDVANYVDATGVIDSGAATTGETDITGAAWQTVTAAGEIGILRLINN
jgi:hypothetical protein